MFFDSTDNNFAKHIFNWTVIGNLNNASQESSMLKLLIIKNLCFKKINQTILK